jgi:hypothetical protein
VQHPERKVMAAEMVTRPLSQHIDFLPEDPATLVRTDGAVQVVATTVAGHPFWEDLVLVATDGVGDSGRHGRGRARRDEVRTRSR